MRMCGLEADTEWVAAIVYLLKWDQEPLMTPEEFREHGHALIDWLADHQVHMAEQPVMSRNQPGRACSAAAQRSARSA